MTLTELRYIVALAADKHFGKAAERCHVSQPTLSVGVKKLEEELDVYIFERSKNVVRLTSVGETIVEQAKKVLEQAQVVRELAQVGKDQLSAPLRIGAIYTIGPYLFPHLIPEINKFAPHMPLYIEENFTHILKEKLRAGDLDAIIVALPFIEVDVVARPIYQEHFDVLLPANHPWVKKESIDVDALDNKNLLLLGEGHCFRDQVLEACPSVKEGKNEFTSIESTSLETIRHMVASGLGISVLPHSAIHNPYYAEGVVVVRPFAEPAPSRTVAIAWRSTFPRIKAIDLLVKAVEQSIPVII